MQNQLNCICLCCCKATYRLEIGGQRFPMFSRNQQLIHVCWAVVWVVTHWWCGHRGSGNLQINKGINTMSVSCTRQWWLTCCSEVKPAETTISTPILQLGTLNTHTLSIRAKLRTLMYWWWRGLSTWVYLPTGDTRHTLYLYQTGDFLCWTPCYQYILVYNNNVAINNDLLPIIPAISSIKVKNQLYQCLCCNWVLPLPPPVTVVDFVNATAYLNYAAMEIVKDLVCFLCWLNTFCNMLITVVFFSYTHTTTLYRGWRSWMNWRTNMSLMNKVLETYGNICLL